MSGAVAQHLLCLCGGRNGARVRWEKVIKDVWGRGRPENTRSVSANTTPAKCQALVLGGKTETHTVRSNKRAFQSHVWTPVDRWLEATRQEGSARDKRRNMTDTAKQPCDHQGLRLPRQHACWATLKSLALRIFAFCLLYNTLEQIKHSP